MPKNSKYNLKLNRISSDVFEPILFLIVFFFFFFFLSKQKTELHENIIYEKATTYHYFSSGIFPYRIHTIHNTVEHGVSALAGVSILVLFWFYSIYQRNVQ